jgi:hypothetical protein
LIAITENKILNEYHAKTSQKSASIAKKWDPIGYSLSNIENILDTIG